MKRTVIKYRDLGDRVEIVGVENLATRGEIVQEFGEPVWERYTTKAPLYGCLFARDGAGDEGRIWLTPKITHSKKEFGRLIKTMKAAGKRLQRIVREEREKEIKEVVI